MLLAQTLAIGTFVKGRKGSLAKDVRAVYYWVSQRCALALEEIG